MGAWADDIPLSHLFIAVPELIFQDAVLKYLRQRGLIDAETIQFVDNLRNDAYKVKRLTEKTKGYPIFTRIMAIAPEILSVPFVNVLRRFDIIKQRDAHILRLTVRALHIAGGGGAPASFAEVFQRAKKLFGLGYSEEALALLRTMDVITAKEANFIRATLMGGTVTAETLKRIRSAKSFLDILLLVNSGLVDKRTIAAMRLAGLLDNRTANALLSAISYGRATWTVFEGAKKADGLAARMGYVVSGSISWEALDVAESLGLVKPGFKKDLLKIAVQASQLYNRGLMEQMTKRRYRVIPGEKPIVTFARASKWTDEALLKLLADSAKEARQHAEALARLGHGAARGAEYTLRARALHQAMRQIWEGTGYLTIFGEHQVAQAALEASAYLNQRYLNHLPEFTSLMLEHQAQSGLDSFISRQENTLQLSKRVYANMALWQDKVDRRINMSLLQGKSAREIAKDVEQYINPNVMGGVKYAAMRLGRTELGNAFHYTTIRSTREMPWIQGYKWYTSGSHGKQDVCDDYAGDDHDNLGPGVFKKANVPEKPHPQCMCWVEAVGMDDDAFVKAFNAGRFDAYLATIVRQPGVEDYVKDTFVSFLARTGGKVAGQVAITAGFSLAERMATHKGGENIAFNPIAFAKMKRDALKAEIARIQAKYFKNSGKSGWAEDSAKASERTVARNTSAIEKQAAAEYAALQKRQASLKRLLHEKQVYEAQYGEGSFNDYLYYHAFPGEERGALHFNVTGLPDEEFAKALYGQSSYHVVNSRLRQVAGDLAAYEARFPDLKGYIGQDSTFFARVKNLLARNDGYLDPNDASHLIDLLHAAVYEDLGIEANKAASKAGVFGFSEASIQRYYEEVMGHGIDESAGLNIMTHINSHSDIVQVLDATMRPMRRSMQLFRVSAPEWAGFASGEVPSASAIGRIFKDPTFTSTEGRPEYFTGHSTSALDLSKRAVRYLIHAPAGTMATRLNSFEYELGLGRGTLFQILDVQDMPEGSAFTHEIHLSVIGQDDHYGDIGAKLAASDEEKMWNDIMKAF